MTRAAHLVNLQAEFKKEMAEIYLLLRDDAVDPVRKIKMKQRLTEVENILLSELDEARGNTEIRRKNLRAEIERETRQRRAAE